MTNEEISVKLTEVDQRSKSNTHRIDKLETDTKAINELATSIRVMVTKQDTLTEKVDCLTSDVKDLKSKPGKRWDSLVEKLIWAVVAAVVGFLLAQVGL